MWRCPHCGAPQAESARCWVCRRSSTTCSTCRHFRAALGGDLGWCALDAKRRLLTGFEQRGCWQERPAVEPQASEPVGAGRPPRTPPFEPDMLPVLARLDFIPVELVGPMTGVGGDRTPSTETLVESVAAPPLLQPPVSQAPLIGEKGWMERTSLFGDPEA